MRSVGPADGVEFLQAWFPGRAFDRHRHDTYGICVTDIGVQQFDYRGASVSNTVGHVIVLHPDEPHDGRAGTEDGFGYRMVYVAPSRIAEAVRSIRGRRVPLPFVRGAVSANTTLARALAFAFHAFSSTPHPLAVDALVLELAQGLIEEDSTIRRNTRPISCDPRAVERAREFLEAANTRVVGSSELEQVTGLSRFDLARQFRQVHGTSPYHYLLMRRLDLARRLIRADEPLVQIAMELGFADQPHMTRLFRSAYGISPSRYRAACRAESPLLPQLENTAPD